ncbi:unnamed protein product [Larinioides sclopetarius]|uniref:long-chain-fatty-acid--CoA ligase n=3 Tax=Larinioides sclopetarius TaxID=280406 RepID=A0AAV2AYR9_9ARAC
MISDLTTEVKPLEKIQEESIEIPNSGGARKSKLVPHADTIQFLCEDAKTLWEVIQRGLGQSDNGPCLGWRHLASDYFWITYSQFISKAENFGSGLINLGLKPGQSSKVGIYAQNSVEWLIAEYGCWSQSAIIVPLYDTMGPSACTFIMNQAEIELVICDEENKVKRLIEKRKETPKLKIILCVKSISQELEDLANEANIKLHLFSDVEKLGELHSVQTLLPKASDLSIICYTSGTTGEPKGAMVTHGNIVSAASVMKLVMGKSSLTKEDRMISYLPLAHMFEQKVQTMAFLEGCSIGFFGGDFKLLEDDMRALQPTFFPAVPRLLNKWCEKARSLCGSKVNIDLNSINFKTKEELVSAHHMLESFKESLGGRVRMIITAAAPLSKDVFEFYTKCLGYEMLEIYGMTELAGACCASLSSYDFKGNVGSPSPCCIIKLIDVPEMNYFSKDLKGEVCIKGHNVLKGYFKNPEKTAEALDDEGWFHSGDIGMWLPNGTLKLIDRKKNIMKLSQGEYVALDRIETVYSASPYISQIYVHGDSLKSFLVAVVIPSKEFVLLRCKEIFENKTWNEICGTPMVKQLILEDMQRLGTAAGLNSFEQVKVIHTQPEAMTLEGGFLTATQKTKRETWCKYFAEEIKAMYECNEEIF